MAESAKYFFVVDIHDDAVPMPMMKGRHPVS